MLDQTDNLVSLWDVFRFLKKNKMFLFFGLAVGAATALVMVVLVPPAWEASAVIKIGHVGVVGPTLDVSSRPIETASEVLGRVMSPEFMHQVDSQSGYAARGNKEELKARQLPGMDLIELKVRAPSKEIATKRMLAAEGLLQTAHDRLMKKQLDPLKQKVAKLEQFIAEGKDAMNYLNKQVMSNSQNASNKILYFLLAQQKQVELRPLEEKKGAISEGLDAAYTFPTAQVGAVYAGDKPVSPRNGPIIFLGAFIGLLGGALLALGYHMRAKYISV